MAMRELAASSSSSNSFTSHQWTYDVFLSFRGEDTRYGFTGNLYHALSDRGIRTFFDDKKIPRGQEITPALLEAIKSSRIAIVVFSPNYSSSTFCLLELVHILEISCAQGPLVWPVFYDVDPSHVRHQRGSYAEALAQHEDRLKDEKEKVQKWRFALRKAAELSGWHFKPKDGYEYEFIEKIVKAVSNKINRTFLNVAKYSIGLEARVLEVKLLMDVGSNDKVNKIGIYGIGGIGKSTVARALYNLIVNQFEFACFLADVREKSIRHGLVKLQEILLSYLAREKDTKLEDVNQGIPILERRFCGKKVLVILDDVDKIEQLRAIDSTLNSFGLGSTLIITTRDKHLLEFHRVEKIYEMKGLNYHESFELLSWNAFDKNNRVDPSYEEVMNCVVQYCQGLPLALEVIGCHLRGKSSKQWKSAIDLCRKVPKQEVQQVLKVSYDCLEEGMQEIFLDIACFFKGKNSKYIKHMVELAHDFDPCYGIEVLIDKSLINIEDGFPAKKRKIEDGHVTMHDLIQDMGREIVRLESTREAGRRSRLWSRGDILHVLEAKTSTDEITIMIQDASGQHMIVKGDGEAFMNMKNLKILIFEKVWFSQGLKYLPGNLKVLKWSGYPSPYLPFDFCPDKLVVLELPNSCLRSIESIRRMTSMRVLNLRACQYVEHIPKLSGISNLEELQLGFCTSLTEIHGSELCLEKLKIFNARGCGRLRTFPSRIILPSLEELVLEGCSSLKYFPEIKGNMDYITHLHLIETAIERLPFSICNLTRLKELVIRGSIGIELPRSIAKLAELKCIDAKRCGDLQSPMNNECQEEVSFIPCPTLELVSLKYYDIPCRCLSMYITCFARVKYLDLEGSNFSTLPASIEDCRSLSKLLLKGCKQLREVTAIPPNLELLDVSGCTSLSVKSIRCLAVFGLQSLSPESMSLLQLLQLEFYRGILCKGGKTLPCNKRKGIYRHHPFRERFAFNAINLEKGPEETKGKEIIAIDDNVYD